MPNLKKLKKYIEKKMEINNNTQFIHSHEILFNKRISLKKYCIVFKISNVNKFL